MCVEYINIDIRVEVALIFVFPSYKRYRRVSSLEINPDHTVFIILYTRYLWCPIMPTTRLEQDFDRFECSVPVTPSHNTSMRLGRNSQSQSHRCWPYYYRYIRAASSIGTAPRLTAVGHNPFSNPVRRPLNLFFSDVALEIRELGNTPPVEYNNIYYFIFGSRCTSAEKCRFIGFSCIISFRVFLLRSLLLFSFSLKLVPFHYFTSFPEDSLCETSMMPIFTTC